MNKLFDMPQSKLWSDWQHHLSEYMIDATQKTIIFTDILRKRGTTLSSIYAAASRRCLF